MSENVLECAETQGLVGAGSTLEGEGSKLGFRTLMVSTPESLSRGQSHILMLASAVSLDRSR